MDRNFENDAVVIHCHDKLLFTGFYQVLVMFEMTNVMPTEVHLIMRKVGQFKTRFTSVSP